MNTPSVWNPMASAMDVPDTTALAGVDVPSPSNGVQIFVDNPGDYYLLVMNSAQVVDGYFVVASQVAGASGNVGHINLGVA